MYMQTGRRLDSQTMDNSDNQTDTSIYVHGTLYCTANVELAQQVLRNFFQNFGLIFRYVSPLDLWIWDPKEFLSLPEVWFLDATRFVRLVLTAVRVTNFFIFAIFDLIFLLSVHINI